MSANVTTTLAGAFGLIPLKSLPVVETDNEALIQKLIEHGGPFPITTRAVEPGFFQRGIQAATNSFLHHAELGIPYELAKKVRELYPDLLIRKKSPRWPEPKPGYPDVMIQGIPKEPLDIECVSSSLTVEIDGIHSVVKKGEQAIAWLYNGWSDAQKIAIVHEAYSWFGEPYDIFEIGNWILPFIPNPPNMKVCATATLTWLAKGDSTIIPWMKANGHDPEEMSPQDIMDWCQYMQMEPVCFNCKLP